MEREENKGSLVSHPMRERSAAYRYRYCFGLGVLAMGNMRAITELQPYYERLLRQLLPDQDQYAQIITDINNDLERHLELVRQTVCDRVDQCCFLMDIYKMCLMAVWSVVTVRLFLISTLLCFKSARENVNLYVLLGRRGETGQNLSSRAIRTI